MTNDGYTSVVVHGRNEQGTKGYPYRDLDPKVGQLGAGEDDRTVRDAWMHNGGWDGQGQREVRHPKEDIGSAFCTQEQVGDLDL